MDDTYTDGIQATRCKHCHGVIHRADEQPRVSLLTSDVEALLCILVDFLDKATPGADLVKRLEQELGRSYRQVSQDRATRDQFAAATLAGLVLRDTHAHPDGIAREAFDLADSMMRQRKEPKE